MTEPLDSSTVLVTLFDGRWRPLVALKLLDLRLVIPIGRCWFCGLHRCAVGDVCDKRLPDPAVFPMTHSSGRGVSRVCDHLTSGLVSPVDIGTMSRNFTVAKASATDANEGLYACNQGDQTRKIIQFEVGVVSSRPWPRTVL
jgi:hypothetical protein